MQQPAERASRVDNLSRRRVYMKQSVVTGVGPSHGTMPPDKASLREKLEQLLHRLLHHPSTRGRPLRQMDLASDPRNPNFEPLDLQLMKMEKKIKTGATFFQPQPVYDPARFEQFKRLVEEIAIPVQMGFILVKSAVMGRYMNEKIAGITVPDSWVASWSRFRQMEPSRSARRCP